MQEMLFQRLQFKKFPGTHSLDNLCFPYSAHTFGDCILPRGGGQGENGPFDSFAQPLKNP
jgi:hypothetical protein